MSAHPREDGQAITEAVLDSEGATITEAATPLRHEPGDGALAPEGHLLLENPAFKPGLGIIEAELFKEIALYREFFSPHRLKSFLGSYFFIDGRRCPEKAPPLGLSARMIKGHRGRVNPC